MRTQFVIPVIVGILILGSGFIGMSEEVFADKKITKHTTDLIHLGYLQLAAHDFFNMDREKEKDSENGLLDLSTVLFEPKAGKCDFEKSLKHRASCALYDDSDIANGGEIRSVENIMISTASAEVGEKYLELVEKYGEKKAYEEILTFYHEQIKKAYEESFHLEFPEPRDGEVTNIHNLALRAGHDFLPAEIKFNGELTSIFAIGPLGEKLSKQEKRQQSSPVDGEFDVEFTGIDFCPVPPFFCIKVDLLVADQSFGEQFELGAGTFDEFMSQLEDGHFDKTDQVSIFLDQAFSRGINLD